VDSQETPLRRLGRQGVLSPRIGPRRAGYPSSIPLKSSPPIDFSSTGPYRKRSLMHEHMFRRSGGSAAVMTREASRDEANWFADEVCVDFPSVAPAIERVRQSFLADERPETLRASIELTDREAARGVTLPLDVPVQCTCSNCGGRGESWSETCLLCRGSGFELLSHSVQVTVPPGVRNGARFCFRVTPRHNRSTRIELHVVVAASR